jgi:hypothetical protein
MGEKMSGRCKGRMVPWFAVNFTDVRPLRAAQARAALGLATVPGVALDLVDSVLVHLGRLAVPRDVISRYGTTVPHCTTPLLRRAQGRAATALLGLDGVPFDIVDMIIARLLATKLPLRPVAAYNRWLRAKCGESPDVAYSGLTRSLGAR